MLYTLALQNRRLKEARQYAEQALEYAPEQASSGYARLYRIFTK